MTELDTDITPTAALLDEETQLRLSTIDERTCFDIGSTIAQRSADEGLATTIGVYLHDRLVYKAAFAGTTSDNDLVIAAKRNVAQLDGHSSLYARNRYLEAGTSFEKATGKQFPEYAPYGGAVPLRTVDDQVLGYVVVSGLTQEEDHRLAVEAIRAAQQNA